MDVLFSLLAAVVFMPMFILIAAAIKIDSKGPVFFLQDRIGKDGKVFAMYKFRTMIRNAEHMGDGLFNYKNDFRVTRVGRILRKTSMDEAAQIINILKGEMSIVGPRPPVTYEHGDYSQYPDEWKRRFSVLPGVTGLAQISGRNELSWDEKVRLDNRYIDLFEKYGVLIDMRIMLITAVKILAMKSIYEKPENFEKEKEAVAVKNMNEAEKRLVWFNGNIVPAAEAKVSILSPTAQFGLNVFEGIRCYWNEEKEQLFAFRLEEHYRRLKNSMKMLRIESGYSVSDFKRGLLDIVRANGYREDIAVRQMVFIEGSGSWNSSEPAGMLIAPLPRGRAYPDREGIKCCFSSWERISDRNLSPKIKAGANYINSRMAQMEAISHGFDTAIFLNSQGKACEGPGACLFIVRDGVLITPPCTASVLESITRDTVIKIAKSEMEIETVVRDIDRTELYICDEAFLCGSAMEIVPILNIDGIAVGGGGKSEIVSRLQEAYFKTVRGNIGKYAEWLTEVY